MSETRRFYFTNLDGLRFFAAFAVICGHYITVFSPLDPSIGTWQKVILSADGSGAEAGVNFFFVLSGFLITYLIFRAPDSRSTRYIWFFYIRRILRIWPLYYLTIIVGFLVYPLFEPDRYVELANWQMYALFLANLDQIYSGNNNLLLGVHWSVAVEEQFYLIWPWLLYMFNTRILLTCVLVTSFVFLAITGQTTHTLSAFHPLAIGATVAHVCFYYPQIVRDFFTKVGKIGVICAYLFGALIVVAKFQLTKTFPGYEMISVTIDSLIFAFVIMDQALNIGSPLQAAKVPIITYLGKISYGLYLLHPIVILIAVNFFLLGVIPSWVVLPCIVIVTIAISSLSYFFFEGWFLTLKEKFDGRIPISAK